jgi:hypothetical protein
MEILIVGFGGLDGVWLKLSAGDARRFYCIARRLRTVVTPMYCTIT